MNWVTPGRSGSRLKRNSRLKSLWPLCLIALLSTGCQTGLFSRAQPQPVTVRVCPPLVAYSTELQAIGNAEVRDLPPESVLRSFMNDYGNLRARLRAGCMST